MEMTSPPNGTVHKKILTTSDAPRMRRINFFIEEPVYQEILEIAQYGGLEFSSAIRELVARALPSYKESREQYVKEVAQSQDTDTSTTRDVIQFAFQF